MARYSHKWGTTESNERARLRSSGPKLGTARQADYGKCASCGATVVLWQVKEFGCWKCGQPAGSPQASEAEYIQRECAQSERDWSADDDAAYRDWSDTVDAAAGLTGDDDLPL